MNMGGGDFLFLSDGNMLLTGDDWGVENLLSVLDLTKKRKYPVGLTSDSERGIRVCTTERYIYAGGGIIRRNIKDIRVDIGMR